MAEWGLNIRGLLLALGEDLEREGLQDTPERVDNAWLEFLEGYTLDPGDILGTTFKTESEGIQACTQIEFSSMCEHHLLPFIGVASIVYLPKKQVLGLSKLARLVDCFARRLQIQERMTQQIAEALFEHVDPVGVLVICKAKHLCCHGRGVRRSRMVFTTTATCGEVKADFWRLVGC